MKRPHAPLLALVVVLGIGRESRSAPIRVQPQVTFDHFVSSGPLNQVISDPDYPGDYGFYINYGHLSGVPGRMAPGWNYTGDGGYGTYESSSYDGELDFKVKFLGSTPGDTATIDFQAHVSALFNRNITSNINGDLLGSVTSARLVDWNPNSSIPYDALAQYLDPTRLTLSGDVTGGGTQRNVFAIRLSIDTSRPARPLPAPEPSTIAILGFLLGGLAIRQRVGRSSPPTPDAVPRVG